MRQISDGSRDDLLPGWSAGGTENIDRLFDEAGRSIGEGFHVEFWQWVVRGIDDVAKIRHSKIEVAVLLSDLPLLLKSKSWQRDRSTVGVRSMQTLSMPLRKDV